MRPGSRPEIFDLEWLNSENGFSAPRCPSRAGAGSAQVVSVMPAAMTALARRLFFSFMGFSSLVGFGLCALDPVVRTTNNSANVLCTDQPRPLIARDKRQPGLMVWGVTRPKDAIPRRNERQSAGRFPGARRRDHHRILVVSRGIARSARARPLPSHRASRSKRALIRPARPRTTLRCPAACFALLVARIKLIEFQLHGFAFPVLGAPTKRSSKRDECWRPC